MARKINTATRREIVEAVGQRYRAADRRGKIQILDEFAALTGYHRKQSMHCAC